MDNEILYLAGREIHAVRPLPPCSDTVCRFLDDFSRTLLKDSACKSYPDIASVAFWARRGNIEKLRKRIGNDEIRIGRGLAFHITPSNIPVQFIFSYMFGLLAGNANIVRVTTKDYPEILLLCRVLEQVLEKYPELDSMTSIVRYPRESGWTREFSSRCQIRLVWGGDDTIHKIREYPLPSKATELVFPDRYSLALLHADAIAEADESTLWRLAQDFYNDTFLMDQNACSSPQLILWKMEGNASQGRERFWQAVRKLAKERYDLQPIKATTKYADFCKNAVLFSETGQLCSPDNYLYHVQLERLPIHVEDLRGRFGLFYEYELKDFSELDAVMNGKYQTLTYFGMDPKALSELVLEHRWLGIDRIVPVGKALDMDIFWDGYDLVREMSRIVDMR